MAFRRHSPAVILLAPGFAAELDCWTDGITRGQCCNAIFGPGGNSHCWDGASFTFESCCGEFYEPRDCTAFVTHFSFSVVGNFGWSQPASAGEAWARCARAMDLEAERCLSL
ncbi:unnamed protein product [Symbiodinium sp. CCMP2592]|nr:unnamed protein product [Symbiodinium sp. CCMP2592]